MAMLVLVKLCEDESSEGANLLKAFDICLDG
jgi:hypothetical protein